MNEYTDVAPNEEVTILLEDLAHPTSYRTLSKEEIAYYAGLDGATREAANEPAKATPAGQLMLVILDIAAIIVLSLIAILDSISMVQMNARAAAPLPEPMAIALIAIGVGLFVAGGICCVLRHMPAILRNEAPALSATEERILRLSAYGSPMLFVVVFAGGLGNQVLSALASNLGIEPFPAWAEWLASLIAGVIVIKLFVGLAMTKPCLATLALSTIVCPVLVIVALSLVSILLMAGLYLLFGLILVVAVVHVMHSM